MLISKNYSNHKSPPDYWERYKNSREFDLAITLHHIFRYRQSVLTYSARQIAVSAQLAACGRDPARLWAAQSA